MRTVNFQFFDAPLPAACSICAGVAFLPSA